MIPEKDSYISIFSFKHDGHIRRNWDQGFVLESDEDHFVVVTNKTWVWDDDGNHWYTREPALCYFYTHRWYNVIAMLRENGIYYYCNLASPALFTAAVTISSRSFGNFSEFAPNVLVLKISQPALRYPQCRSMISSGLFRFHVSGSSPPCSPFDCRIVPVPPSKISHSFPSLSRKSFFIHFTLSEISGFTKNGSLRRAASPSCPVGTAVRRFTKGASLRTGLSGSV